MRTAACAIGLLVLASACHAQQPKNLALNRPYTLSPAPNYGYCTDPGDNVQLTDGIQVDGYFWVQQGCVGWQTGLMNFITIDLGRVCPISGISYDTAAGVAGVHWPSAIIIFVSDDGKTWHEVGDLVKLQPAGALAEYGVYTRTKLVTNALKAHGRYVQLAVQPNGSYSFVDEIEVYEGTADMMGIELPGAIVGDVVERLKTDSFNNLLRLQFQRDLAGVRKSIETAGLGDEQKKGLTAKADALAGKISDMAEESPIGFRAVLPMTELERQVFLLQAEVWRAEGKASLRVWHADRWDYLGPSEEPPATGAEPAMTVRMMNGESRADVLNVTNAGATNARPRLRIEGLPGGTNPAYVTVRQATHVGTKFFKPVAAALVGMEREGSDWILNVPSGMTAQAWVQFKPTDVAPGRYEGKIVVTGAGGSTIARAPVRLYISPIRFPEKTRLRVGGWDYAEGGGTYGVNPKNRAAFVELLREHHVNTAWAGAGAMPPGKYDDAGNMTEKPDTAVFDDWVKIWHGAEQYMVYVAAGGDFAGAQIGTPEFTKRVGEWMHFWAAHMKALGLKVGQLGFLVLDEPNEAQGFRVNAEWAKAIHAAEPELKCFVDPTPEKPDGMDDMVAQMDILCPNRMQWLDMGWQDAYYAEQVKRGKQLWMYSCSGPMRGFDPYCYYLLQAWHLAAVGGTGSGFWAFGDWGGTSPWNDYVSAGAGAYCPLYIDETTVTPAKWLEAIGESAEDFEYLAMLKDKVEKAEAEGKGGAAVEKAKALLVDGPRRVLAGMDGSNVAWDRHVDRDVADSVRREVLEAIEGR